VKIEGGVKLSILYGIEPLDVGFTQS
jgi:hypothetical protein